jgi:arylsulfatase A-like enzyme
VFDEMDGPLAFPRRPRTVRLPELDQLRAEALSAENAHSPAGKTLRAMPALITGRLVSEAAVVDPSELNLTFAESAEAVPWSVQPNVFSRAREAGYNTALSGWYHPYCRILGHTVTQCTNRDARSTLLASAREQLLSLVDCVPFASRLLGWEPPWFELSVPDARQRYWAVLEDAKRWATDPDLGLILLHWAFPHRPILYDRHRASLEPTDRSNYFDNLILVDRTVGELRRAMQRAGIWDSTVVLVTADHGFRSRFFTTTSPKWPPEENAALVGADGLQVPFILKLGGQRDAIRYEPPFNTVLTHDLLLALLRREVSSPASVVSWLDRHRSIGPTPYP